MNEKHQKILEVGKKTINSYIDGHIEGPGGYKLRTKPFLDVLFLYNNGVTLGNPDILGKDNSNTFIHDAISDIETIKKESRIDLKDINFLINGASSLARFVVKAANRKMLKDNTFSDDLDFVLDDAIDYGSGFLKVWEINGKMKMRHIDPFHLIWNPYNFAKGMVIERLPTTVREILSNDKYDADAKEKLMGAVSEDQWDERIVIYQGVTNTWDDEDEVVSQRITIFDKENDLVYYDEEFDEDIVTYFKFDRKKRRGFADALGIGANEVIFNKLVQSKVNRERLDAVMEIASKMPFQKEIDNKRDAYVGKEITKLKTGKIMGHKGNPITVMDTGGIKQANLINQQLGQIVQSISSDLNVGDALNGNTLPSGTSGALGNLLTENASSVHKEVKKHYATFIGHVYDKRLTDYLLRIFDSSENLVKYLDPNDIKTVETNVINYLVSLKQVDAAINGEEFSIPVATEEVKQEIKKKDLISGDLLERLRDEVKGIDTFISGEKTSKAQTVAFLREMRSAYAANPDLFKSAFYVETLKKEAEFEAGISGVEIDNLLKELA